MRRIALSAAAAAAAIAIFLLAPGADPASAATKPANRCGILENPTPGNFWLNDRDGQWIIGVQLGYQAEGMDALPESLFEDGWVRTNGYYGYRCACLSVDSDPRTKRIRRIHSAKPLPMKRCTDDKSIKWQH